MNENQEGKPIDIVTRKGSKEAGIVVRGAGNFDALMAKAQKLLKKSPWMSLSRALEEMQSQEEAKK